MTTTTYDPSLGQIVGGVFVFALGALSGVVMRLAFGALRYAMVYFARRWLRENEELATTTTTTRQRERGGRFWARGMRLSMSNRSFGRRRSVGDTNTNKLTPMKSASSQSPHLTPLTETDSTEILNRVTAEYFLIIVKKHKSFYNWTVRFFRWGMWWLSYAIFAPPPDAVWSQILFRLITIPFSVAWVVWTNELFRVLASLLERYWTDSLADQMKRAKRAAAQEADRRRKLERERSEKAAEVETRKGGGGDGDETRGRSPLNKRGGTLVERLSDSRNALSWRRRLFPPREKENSQPKITPFSSAESERETKSSLSPAEEEQKSPPRRETETILFGDDEESWRDDFSLFAACAPGDLERRSRASRLRTLTQLVTLVRIIMVIFVILLCFTIQGVNAVALLNSSVMYFLAFFTTTAGLARDLYVGTLFFTVDASVRPRGGDAVVRPHRASARRGRAMLLDTTAASCTHVEMGRGSDSRVAVTKVPFTYMVDSPLGMLRGSEEGGEPIMEPYLITLPVTIRERRHGMALDDDDGRRRRRPRRGGGESRRFEHRVSLQERQRPQLEEEKAEVNRLLREIRETLANYHPSALAVRPVPGGRRSFAAVPSLLLDESINAGGEWGAGLNQTMPARGARYFLFFYVFSQSREVAVDACRNLSGHFGVSSPSGTRILALDETPGRSGRVHSGYADLTSFYFNLHEGGNRRCAGTRRRRRLAFTYVEAPTQIDGEEEYAMSRGIGY